MSLHLAAKRAAEGLPPWLGQPLARLPFGLRLGPAYGSETRAADRLDRMDDAAATALAERRLRAILTHAEAHVPFWRDLFARAGVSAADFRGLSDLARFPVVTKADLAAAPIERRLHGTGLAVNTGGTSGQPLRFHLDGRAFAREWAHMHRIWYARGYRKEHLKLTLRGKHFAEGAALRYNAVHNELVANADQPIERIVDAALAPGLPPIRWVHGYPSLVAEFATEIARRDGPRTTRLRQGLRGALLGSEFPAPLYRDPIESVLTANVVSWYGHSEMAVLAPETARGLYMSLPGYGYAEGVPTGEAGVFRLVCTSYGNTVHPFIRYDTGDLVEVVSQSARGLAFRVVEGRVGDFVLDRQGRRHALTAIIFGRHHRAFDDLAHVQVADLGSGRIRLLATPLRPGTTAEEVAQGFDLAGLDIDWTVEILDRPVRTPAGKIRLKIESP